MYFNVASFFSGYKISNVFERPLVTRMETDNYWDRNMDI